mmetsp:Transcript_27355/g.63705  ORF Transcript_27355/g.63705 Transcript_27355/m.63705 type:complete len:387 (-) Transcript_27355:14-1174(-)
MPSPAPVPNQLLDFFLFPSPTPTYDINSFPGELIWIPRTLHSGGTAPEPGSQMVPCLLKTFESSRFLFIYFHSNAEDLGVCRWFLNFMHEQFQAHVLAVEYPGYGVCPGRATPEGVVANAHAALQFATKTLKLTLDRIMVFGRSLGTGPAIELASRHRVAGLILVTPFISVKEVFRHRIGKLADVLEHDWFPNSKSIARVRSPTLVIHGKQDDLIPHTQGEAVYKECIARKGLVCPPQMSHNSNITSDLSIFVMPMLQFFPLPDCDFNELEVPDWAYWKSWSPSFMQEADSHQQDADDEKGERDTMEKEAQGPTVPKVEEVNVDKAVPYAVKHARVRHLIDVTRHYSFGGGGARLTSLAAQPVLTSYPSFDSSNNTEDRLQTITSV